MHPHQKGSSKTVFADDMILYTENSKHSTKKLLELNSEVSLYDSKSTDNIRFHFFANKEQAEN